MAERRNLSANRKDLVAEYARGLGAVYEADRRGLAGEYLGRSFYAADGRLVFESTSACGNRVPG